MAHANTTNAPMPSHGFRSRDRNIANTKKIDAAKGIPLLMECSRLAAVNREPSRLASTNPGLAEAREGATSSGRRPPRSMEPSCATPVHTPERHNRGESHENVARDKRVAPASRHHPRPPDHGVRPPAAHPGLQRDVKHARQRALPGGKREEGSSHERIQGIVSVQ